MPIDPYVPEPEPFPKPELTPRPISVAAINPTVMFVADSYNALLGYGNHPMPADMVHHWVCDDASGSTIVDRSTHADAENLTTDNPFLSVAGPTSYLPNAVGPDATVVRGAASEITAGSPEQFKPKSFMGWGRIRSDSASLARGIGGYQLSLSNRPGNCYHSPLGGFAHKVFTTGQNTSLQIGNYTIPTDTWVCYGGSLSDLTGDPEYWRGRTYIDGSFNDEYEQFSTAQTAVTGRWLIGSGTGTTPGYDGRIANLAGFYEEKTADEFAEYFAGPEPYWSAKPLAPNGLAEVGGELNADTTTIADPGNGSISYAYQWFTADDIAGSNPVDVVGQTASSYTVQAGDAFVGVKITPSNLGGTDPLEADTASVVVEISGGPPTFNPAWANGSTQVIQRTI